MVEARKDMVVQGVDMRGNNITGRIENVVRLAGVAIIRTGEDRLDVTQAYLSDLEEYKG